MRECLLISLAMYLLAGGASGCGSSRRPADRTDPAVEPLPLQQSKAYPETVTGLFVSLAEFEDVPGGPGGYDQVGYFHVAPRDGSGRCRFVVNVTRTGAGAMEVTLSPGSELVFRIPFFHDFRGYTLLSLALYSPHLRDDLHVTLTTDAASWSSHPTLVRPGWNNVLIDIRRLEEVGGFDMTSVRTLRLRFADAASPVTFNIDDIMLIDNTRTIEPVPDGIKLVKKGLDYELTLPTGNRPVALRQGADGLWRFSRAQPALQLAPPAKPLAAGGEDLELMGPRKVGVVEILENNPIRLRLANTWYFPTRAGQWASLAVRRIRWEHTFYRQSSPGGPIRRVTHVELNNSGGEQIGSLRIALLQPAAWADGTVLRELTVEDFTGPIGQWSYMEADDAALRRSYLNPARLIRLVAAPEAFAVGDSDRDGFDESQGCYFLQATAGHCRFTIVPNGADLVDGVFRVAGRWRGPVSVNCQGLAIRNVVRLKDASVLFRLGGRIDGPVSVEVMGQESPLSNR